MIAELLSLKSIYDDLADQGIMSDKGSDHSYLPWYEEEFSIYRYPGVRLLEIGILKGESLKLWREYFGPESIIVGVDNQLSKPVEGTEIVYADATQRFLWRKYFENRKFDIIIDDGSHYLNHQLATFSIYCDSLAYGGIYIIEDVQTDEGIDTLRGQGFEIVDLRGVKGRWDDVLAVWRKPNNAGLTEPPTV